MFVFGALMAFTTLKVSSTFNESGGITLAIYNVCYRYHCTDHSRHIGCRRCADSAVSLGPDVDRVLHWAILFVPKVMQIVYHTDTVGQMNSRESRIICPRWSPQQSHPNVLLRMPEGSAK
jgi:hypothetical protein